MGYFITFEGGEGTGKSTLCRMLRERMLGDGLDVVATREPGGTDRAEQLREVLKSGQIEDLGTDVEAIVINAARDDHIRKLIRPALDGGQWVICDRFIDSTRVYQGIVGGVDSLFLGKLEQIVLDGLYPDMTVLVDLPVNTALARIHARDFGRPELNDRFQRENLAFHESVRHAFLELAENESERFFVVDGNQDPVILADTVWQEVMNRFLDTTTDE